MLTTVQAQVYESLHFFVFFDITNVVPGTYIVPGGMFSAAVSKSEDTDIKKQPLLD